MVPIGVAFVSTLAALAMSALVAIYYIIGRTPTPLAAEDGEAPS